LAHLRFLTQPRPTSPLPHAGPPANRSSGLRPAHPAFPSPPSGKPTEHHRPPPPPPLLAASASPSFGNRRTPPSMALPSLHRRPVASLPLGTAKRRFGRASPHPTPPSFPPLSCRSSPPPRRLVAWPPHHRSPSGEALDGTPVLHFPSLAPWPSA
jgi:hypothetical protein